jgi:protein sprouty family protein 2
MDRGNGGDPQAPPRPPKTFPKVHRPRALEPNTAATATTINSSGLSNFQNRMERNNDTDRQQPASPSPITAPLTPLQNNSRNINSNQLMSVNTISTFSRRRPDVRQQSPLPSARTTTPIVSTATNLLSNAVSSIGSRTPSPTTATQQQNSVSLQIPRPENERLPNEYVDTPFTNNKTTVTLPRHPQQQPAQQNPNQPHTPLVPNRNQQSSHLNTNISTIDGISVIDGSNIDKLPNRINSNISNNSNNNRPNLLPITKQPAFNSNTLCKKEQLQHQFSHCQDDVVTHGSNNNSTGIIVNNDQLNSITCPQCKRCRCEECLRPRQLPSRWICNNYCYCSPETLIDYASCLCCVKGLYYHCSNHEMECENEEVTCADDPCSCVPYKRTTRWGCLSALSLILPCLLCYWPMKGCVSLCAKCYANHSRYGCRCNNNTSNNNNRPNLLNLTTNNSQTQQPTNHHRRIISNDSTTEKRLLDSSSNEF